MEAGTTIIREEIGRGTRGGPYVYVVDGEELVHINDYAIRRVQDEYWGVVEYEVPVGRVAGKVLYCFDFSRSGWAFLCRCRIEDFEGGYPNSNKCRCGSPKEYIHELRGLKFRVRDRELLSLIEQFKQIFVPMIQEVKQYEGEKGFEIRFGGHQARLWEAFEDPEVHYFTFMSLPDDRRRIASLRVTRRWVYQLWVLKLLCEALRVSEFKEHVYDGRPYWWVEQGSGVSTAVARTPIGDVTLWLEFQPSRYAHMQGWFTGRRVPVRPDIVVARGSFRRAEELANSGRRIDLIVECKEDPFDRWRGDIESQILPYQRAFNPSNLVIASLERVPGAARRYLESLGVRVVDDLRVGSGSIAEFRNLIRELLGVPEG